MFDGTLGKYIGSDNTKELQVNINQYHTKPFPIPKIHEPSLKNEVDTVEDKFIHIFFSKIWCPLQ